MVLENGKKQPWYITRKANEPVFMVLADELSSSPPSIEQKLI